MALLKVKKEHLNDEIAYESNGSSYQVALAKASQDQLKVLKELGYFDHIFEKEEKK